MSRMNTIYAVIDLGSWYIRGMVARKMEDGRVSPISFYEEPANNCIRHGCVHNIDEAAAIIRRIVNQLNENLEDNTHITSLYVGVGGQSIASQEFIVRKAMVPEGEVIRTEHIESLWAEMRGASFPDKEVLDVTDPLFYVDGKQEIQAKGVFCHELEARFQLITARRSVKQNIRIAIEERLGLRLAGILVTPLCEAQVLLSDDELTLGCCYVNIGAGCTSVSIYKNRLLAMLRVLPMGGYNVTRDLTSLRLTEQEAENMKLNHVSMINDNKSNGSFRMTFADKFSEREFRSSEVNRLAKARMDEITANYLNILRLSGLLEDIGAGIILNGGGTKINNYMAAMKKILGEVTPAKIRMDRIDTDNAISFIEEHISTIGLAYKATQPCTDYITTNLGELVNQIETKEEIPANDTVQDLFAQDRQAERKENEQRDNTDRQREDTPRQTLKKKEKTGPSFGDKLKGAFIKFGSLFDEDTNQDNNR
ncbi:cell division protein FtsA [Porphyromonas gingivalis]|uniref:cell division protein FtsA n=1 Tax=Porphyromonas gingivalis TaxID=837 RepID=UPI0015CF51FC|nr:cell division FtsA domain-containing protein [Porphyromonas gingivalis]